MSEWKPIETAPKDGTPILGYDPQEIGAPRDNIAVMAWYNPYSSGEPTEWVSTAYEVVRYRPTHWMPLPTPPVDSQTEH